MMSKRLGVPSEKLMDPLDESWSSAPEEAVTLAPTPLAQQPSTTLRSLWKEVAYGAVSEVRVRAAHNGVRLLFRLEWGSEGPVQEITEINVFPDAAGVLFPLWGQPDISSMGSADAPVNAWYWRADFSKPRSVTAGGTGTAVRRLTEDVVAQGSWSEGRWRVVIGRAFAAAGTGEYAAPLAPGRNTKVGFAVWTGSNSERAGFKAYTPLWIDLSIEG
jgi:complex iron-sulfur molybdoenzyme family reductase subunit gamma